MDVLSVLEVSIGIVLIYLILSLICTALVEAVVSSTGVRPKVLEKSIQSLVGDDLAKEVYASDDVAVLRGPKGKKLQAVNPSYIPTGVFARAILDIATNKEWRRSGGVPSLLREKFLEFAKSDRTPKDENKADDKGAKPGDAADDEAGKEQQESKQLQSKKPESKKPKEALGNKLVALLDEAGGDISLLQNKIELWFDRTGDRSKGWYKRRVNTRLILIGFMVALFVNADTITIFERLSDDPAARQAAVQIAEDRLQQADASSTGNNTTKIDEIREAFGEVAPFVGWSDLDPLLAEIANDEHTFWSLSWVGFLKVAGLLLTAFAISLGAPFWFDLLQRLMSIRKTIAAAPAKDLQQERQSSAATPGSGSEAKSSDAGKKTADDGADGAAQTPEYTGAMAGFAPAAAKVHLGNAYWLAKASDLGYETDIPKLSSNIASWGMTLHPFESDKDADKKLWGGITLEQADTQGFVAIDENAVVVCFRGTEPTKPADIITDLSFKPERADAYGNDGTIHSGFKAAVESVWGSMSRILEEHATNRQPVWFCGHSLGGALAVLAGSRYDLEVRRSNLLAKKEIADAEEKMHAGETAELVKQRQDALNKLRGRVAGIYTIGQPRVGDDKFAKDIDERIGDAHVRVINNRDVVPRVPLRAMDFEHSGTVLYLDEFGRLHRDPGLWFRLLDTIVISRAEVAKAREGVLDHSSKNYVDLLDKARKSNSALTRLAVA